ncbi:MAG: TrmB family transcriptional regulator [Chloroflexi bacterium]|nr:TrmB family transcriptional regulator [Chloroflexota bacterium]
MTLGDLIARLTRLGFSEWEAKAYLALLQRSPVTGYQVSRESGVPRSMVYEVLGKLVSRGAALTTHDGDTTLYAPIPPLELMERLQREQESLTNGLKQDLVQVSQASDEEYVWRIQGYENILARAWKLIEGARQDLWAQMYADDFERLRPAFEAATARGVRVSLSAIGAVQLPNARVVELPVTEVYSEVASFGLLLVADRHEVLLGERSPAAQARGSWSRNHQLATIVEGHVRRAIVVPAIYRALGVDGVLGLMEGDERALMEAILDRQKAGRLAESRGEGRMRPGDEKQTKE